MALGLLLFALQTRAGVAEPLLAWKKADLRVCWGEGDLAMGLGELQRTLHAQFRSYMFRLPGPSLRKSMQQRVEREYTPQRTGIHFSGWQTCAEDPHAQIIIVYSPLIGLPMRPYNGVATLGDSGTMDDPYGQGPQSSQRFVHLIEPLNNSLGPRESLAAALLHELGHVAGLRHESMRDEAAQDEQCQTFYPHAPAEKIGPHTVFYTPYDPASIMNYCRLGRLTGQARSNLEVALSEDDLLTLRCLYSEECLSRALFL